MGKRAAAIERTRRRIVEATLALHAEQGIRATSWEEIARRAGVGVGTVYRHFPSLADLVPACGVVTFDQLALPRDPGERFRGVRGRKARMRRLVEELFAIYQRGAPEIENVRRERYDAELSMLQAAHAEIEAALDGLVVEALRPLDGTQAHRRTVRALTDLGVWRSLRDRGIMGEAAVDTLATMLASWLERVSRESRDAPADLWAERGPRERSSKFAACSRT